MPASLQKKKYKVTYGGWFQRTTLHLSEIYVLFMRGASHLDLSREELQRLYKGLDLVSVSRESSYLEYVRATTASGIEIRFYEDGLHILEMDTDDVSSAQKTLETYFQERLGPAIAYIFSLGAPTPKILANIRTTHPVVVSTFIKKGAGFKFNESLFGEVYTTISSDDITVYKTPQYIFIAAQQTQHTSLRDLIEMQIFFREFKDQLEKYLAIHRSIWEEISDIKEAKVIRGKDVENIRGKLDGYQKTISLISNRINQMGSYVNTRSSLAKNLQIEKSLVALFEYKFETLTDTLSYIKEIWKMTSDYLASAIANLLEIKGQSTSNNLKSLQTITSIGVISGILGYLSANNLPRVSWSGIIYFVILFALTWVMNYVIVVKYKNKQYSLKFGAQASDI
ncbi:MAG: Rab5-interacting family protein [Candidatus Pacebacteria bacterium]|nr:Rab5-interacting family protein [Candidatus Paceibacterota bacterium]